MPLNLNKCDKLCSQCIKDYINKHRLKKGDSFNIGCKGIPKNYVPDDIIASLGEDPETIEAMLNPVLWAKKFLDWHCIDPEGKEWKRKTEEGTLGGRDTYDEELAKRGKSIYHRPYQKIMLCCSSKRKLFRVGRQAGKSESLCISILYNMFIKEKFKVEVIAPYQSQVDLIFTRLGELISGSVVLQNTIHRSVKAPQHTIELKNGSTCVGFTSGTRSKQEAGSSRGQAAGMLVFDEADMLSKQDIDAALAVIINFREATVWMSSTPTGKREKFYESSLNKQYKEFHFPSQVNPSWNEEKEDYFRSELTEDGYQHEILASWGEQEEGVYKLKYVEAAQASYTYDQMTPSPKWLYMMGVDWNKIRQGTTIAIVGLNPNDGYFYVVDKHSITPSNRTQLNACQKIAELNRLWSCSYIYVDAGYGMCVGSGTLIQTDTGCVPIKDIQIGTKIITSSGEYHKVLNKVQTEPKRSFLLKPSKCIETEMSYCHPLLVLRTEDRFKDKVFDERKLKWVRCEDINQKLDFVAIRKQKIAYKKSLVIDILDFLDKKYLNWDNDYVWSVHSGTQTRSYSVRQLSKESKCGDATISRLLRKLKNGYKLTDYQKSIKEYLDNKHGVAWVKSSPIKTKRFIDITDPDFQFFLGWYLSEGNLNKATIELSQKKPDFMKEFLSLQEIGLKYFGSVSSYIKQNGTYRIFINNRIARDLIEVLCGKLSYKKQLHPIFQQIECNILLKGIILGDGHQLSSGINGIQLSLTSFDLIMQIRQNLINHGILPSLYYVIKEKYQHKNQLRIDLGGNPEIVNKITKYIKIEFKNQTRVSRRSYIDTGNYLLVPIDRFKEVGLRNDLWDIEIEGDHSFHGNGFILHNTQIEMLHDYGQKSLAAHGSNHPDARLRNIVKGYDFGSSIEIRDIFTNQPVKKPAKPFLVENSVRRFENLQIKYPAADEQYTKQLLGYIIERVTVTGRPTYAQQDEKAGDHFLDSVNLALVAFALEKGRFSKPLYMNDIAFAGAFGRTDNPRMGNTLTEEAKKYKPRNGRADLLKPDNSVWKPVNGELPASNTNIDTSVSLWRWDGFSRDEPRPKTRSLQKAMSDARNRVLGPSRRNRPVRKKF